MRRRLLKLAVQLQDGLCLLPHPQLQGFCIARLRCLQTLCQPCNLLITPSDAGLCMLTQHTYFSLMAAHATAATRLVAGHA